MRVIALPADEKEAQSVFGIFHTAAFGGEGAKDHAKARVLGKLQDVLEAVSEDAVTDGVQHRALLPGTVEIRLDDAYCELLKERIFGAGIPWLANATRRVNAAYDAVHAAVEEKPGVAKKDEAGDGEPPKKGRGKR